MDVIIKYAIICAALAVCAGIAVHGTAAAEPAAPPGPNCPAADGQLRPAAQSSQAEQTTFLPTGDLFYPLIADPKEPRFYVSYRISRYRSDTFYTAAGGFGELFGLYRHNNTAGGYSWQSDFGGAIHAQFNLHSPSFDLVNSDYIIGFPVSFRKDNESYRVVLYHQSSHLGDEFLLHNNIQRVEFSFEAIEALRSQEWRNWRLYYGGDYIIHQGPTNIRPMTIHTGMEYYGSGPALGRGRVVAGLDLKLEEQHNWSVNSSLKAGLQFDSSAGNGRYIRVLAEHYQGFTPYGQFYNDRISYLGAGIYLGFE